MNCLLIELSTFPPSKPALHGILFNPHFCMPYIVDGKGLLLVYILVIHNKPESRWVAHQMNGGSRNLVVVITFTVINHCLTNSFLLSLSMTRYFFVVVFSILLEW